MHYLVPVDKLLVLVSYNYHPSQMPLLPHLLINLYKFDVIYNNVDPWENIINLDGTKLSSLTNYNHKWKLFNFMDQEINNLSIQ